jgi:segregation and condensation protein B
MPLFSTSSPANSLIRSIGWGRHVCTDHQRAGLDAGETTRRDWQRAAAVPTAVDVFVIAGVPRESIRTPKMARVEAVLLVADAPLPARKLAQIATLADSAEVTQAIEQLNRAYAVANAAFRIERVATGYRLLTLPHLAYWLSRLHQRQAELKLSPAALDTLTIIAYRQPLTRADLEAIRGLASTDLIKQLMDRGLVRIGGEDTSLGRPFLYETTRKFLDVYGLRSLDDLPHANHLRKPMAKPVASPALAVADTGDE